MKSDQGAQIINVPWIRTLQKYIGYTRFPFVLESLKTLS